MGVSWISKAGRCEDGVLVLVMGDLGAENGEKRKGVPGEGERGEGSRDGEGTGRGEWVRRREDERGRRREREENGCREEGERVAIAFNRREQLRNNQNNSNFPAF